MLLYERYIFQKVSYLFLAILSLLITLIWFSKTISFVKYITENGIELSQFLFLFLLILPWLLLFIVPISFFAAIIATFNRMIMNNEITILRNAGLTKTTIIKPIIKIATYTTLFCYIISFFVMPYANKKLRLARIDFENNYSNIAFSEGVFESLKSLTIYVKNKDEAGNLFGIMLHDEREKQYSLTITAKNGSLSFENDNLLLYMQEGTLQRFNHEDKKSEILNFDNYVFNLSENQDSQKKEMRWKPKERYLQELIFPEEGVADSDKANYRAEVQQRLTYPLMSIILAMIASSIMLKGNFNRHGNVVNIVSSLILAIAFLIITITIYRLIETKFYLTLLLYLNFIIFFAISYYLLIHNNFKKR